MLLKKIFVILLLLIFLVELSFCEVEVPRYPCFPITVAPQIDGILSDKCWTQLPAVGCFVDGSYIVSSVQTVAMLAYDSNNLYLGVRLDEPAMDKIVANKTEHDKGVWEDDDLEFFVAPAIGSEEFFQFCVNSKGVTEERRNTDLPEMWNGHWQSAVKREAEGWTIEIAIPFETLGQPCPQDGTIWQMNVSRNRMGASRISSWSGTKDFQSRENFGEIIFLKHRLLQSISPALKQNSKTSSDLSAENELDVSIQAVVSGDYKIRYHWFGDKYEVREAASPVKSDVLKQFTERFPLSEKPSMAQIEILPVSKPDQVLYRSERMITVKSDGRAANLASIESLIGKLKKAETPAHFKDVIETWPNKLKTLEANIEQRSIEKLLHECKIVELATKLAPNWRSETTLWFSLPPFTSTDYDYIPEVNDIGTKVSVTAMRGEYESGCVNILLMDTARDVILKVNNLVSDVGNVFDVGNIDIRILKYWYQAGSESGVDKEGNATWTGELLLKDDSIVEPDHSRQRNILHSTEDSPILKPVNIKRFESRQFWLTTHIPQDQKPGVYRGYAEAMSGDVVLARIPIEVKVLPLAMEPTKFGYTMYYVGLYSNGKDPNNDARYEEDLRTAAANGFTSMLIREGATAEMKDGFVVSYDFSVVKKAMELRKKYGLTGKTIFEGNHWQTQPLDRVFRISEEQLVSEPQHKANYIKFCKELAEISAEMGFDLYIYTWDEPSYDSTGINMRMCSIVNQWAHDGNMKTSAAITIPGAKELTNLDLPVLDMPSGVIKEKRRILPFKEAWCYAHPLENPMFDRLSAGLMVWYGGFTGAAPFAYNALGEWDDWKCDTIGLRPMHYAYLGKRSPVPTWQLAAFRDGSDDVRYLEMLEKRVKRAEKIGIETFDAKDRQLLAQGREIIDVAPEKFRGNAINVPLRVTAMDFYQFRQKVAELLVKTDEVLIRINKD